MYTHTHIGEKEVNIENWIDIICFKDSLFK